MAHRNRWRKSATYLLIFCYFSHYIISEAECHASRERYSFASSSDNSRPHLLTFNSTRRKSVYRSNNHDRSSTTARRQPRKQALIVVADQPSSAMASSKQASRNKFAQGIMSKKDVGGGDMWDESCARDRHDMNQNTSRIVTLWKYDAHSLQACDIPRPGPNETATAAQPVKLITTKFGYLKRQTPSTKQESNYCEATQLRRTDSNDELGSICGPKVDLNQLTLPFCHHLTVWQVLHGNPALRNACGENYTGTPPKDQCETCSSELIRQDKLARLGYCALEAILDRADCKVPYSPTNANCLTCKISYRLWICAQFFDRLRFSAADSQSESLTTEIPLTSTSTSNASPTPSLGYVNRHPCPSVCHNVTKLCPYTNPIWDDANKRPGVQTLEAVEYSGWPAFHCPTTLPFYMSEDDLCYAFSLNENTLETTMVVLPVTSTASSLLLSFQFSVFFVFPSIIIVIL